MGAAFSAEPIRGAIDRISQRTEQLFAEHRQLIYRRTDRVIAGLMIFQWLAEEIAATHHERWDGGGYPNGLSGRDIPLAGRIIAVVDVFDALTSRRPYKEPWPVEQAIAEIERLSGAQFDPSIVHAFERVMEALPGAQPLRLAA